MELNLSLVILCFLVFTHHVPGQENDTNLNVIKVLEISTLLKLNYMEKSPLNKSKAVVCPANKSHSKELQVNMRHRRDIISTHIISLTVTVPSNRQDRSSWKDWSNFLLSLSPSPCTNERKTYRSLFPIKISRKRFELKDTSTLNSESKEGSIRIKPTRIKRLGIPLRKMKKMFKRIHNDKGTSMLIDGLTGTQVMQEFDIGRNPYSKDNYLGDSSRAIPDHLVPPEHVEIQRPWGYNDMFNRLENHRELSSRNLEPWMRGDPSWRHGYGPHYGPRHGQNAWPVRNYENWAKDQPGKYDLGSYDVPESRQRDKSAWGPRIKSHNEFANGQRVWPGKIFEGFASTGPSWSPDLDPQGNRPGPWPRRDYENLLRHSSSWGNKYDPKFELRDQGVWPAMNSEHSLRNRDWIGDDSRYTSSRSAELYNNRIENGQRAWPEPDRNSGNFFRDNYPRGPEFDSDRRQQYDQKNLPGRNPNGLGRDDHMDSYPKSNYINDAPKGHQNTSVELETPRGAAAWLRGNPTWGRGYGPNTDQSGALKPWPIEMAIGNDAPKGHLYTSMELETRGGAAAWLRGNPTWGRGYGPNNDQSGDSKTWPIRIEDDGFEHIVGEKQKVDLVHRPDNENWVGGGPEGRWKGSLDQQAGGRNNDRSRKDQHWSRSPLKENKSVNILDIPRDRLEGHLWSSASDLHLWDPNRIKDDRNIIDMEHYLDKVRQSDEIRNEAMQSCTKDGIHRVPISVSDKDRRKEETRKSKSSTSRVTKLKEGKYGYKKMNSRPIAITIHKNGRSEEPRKGTKHIPDTIEGDEHDKDLNSSDKHTQIYISQEPVEWPWDKTTEENFPDNDTDEYDILKDLDKDSKERPLRSHTPRCYTCGLNETGIPIVPRCYDAFDNEDHRFYWRRPKYKTYCLRGEKEKDDPPNVDYHPDTIPGCYKRFTDIGGIYYEKGCRGWPPRLGGTVASERFARLERLLRSAKDRCVFSPNAVLTPFARGISLWVRYHVCVCRGDLCNAQSIVQLASFILLLTMLVIWLNIRDTF